MSIQNHEYIIMVKLNMKIWDESDCMDIYVGRHIWQKLMVILFWGNRGSMVMMFCLFIDIY